ncbi:molybdopterin-dependent oxidoreductase [Roseibium sediminis]|uniref:molybdopterin-dependent oxidoreductase n=1 Tax=Roseibium sediminis TaxID=1775174 RepID=UPI00123E0C45|nr:molybdopterin-dependent oxidoreductase [Roseibium sediminis]
MRFGSALGPLAVALSLTILQLPFAATASAAETLFALITADGTSTDVTDKTFEEIGYTEIKTRLVGEADTVSTVRGVLFSALLDHYGVDAETVQVTGLDGYMAELPVDELKQYPVVIATEVDGNRLSVRSKGPGWVVYPFTDHPEIDDQLREARCVWQVRDIAVRN